jgi:hypothetical protein
MGEPKEERLNIRVMKRLKAEVVEVAALLGLDQNTLGELILADGLRRLRLETRLWELLSDRPAESFAYWLKLAPEGTGPRQFMDWIDTLPGSASAAEVLEKLETETKHKRKGG